MKATEKHNIAKETGHYNWEHFLENHDTPEKLFQAGVEFAQQQKPQREWVNADKLADRIVLNLDAHARGVNRVEYGLPLDPDTKSFDNPLAMDLKTIVLEVLSQSTKNK